MKSLYRHKRSGDIFAIETDDAGHVFIHKRSAVSDDLDPKFLDYDEYWNTEVQAKIERFYPHHESRLS